MKKYLRDYPRPGEPGGPDAMDKGFPPNQGGRPPLAGPNEVLARPWVDSDVIVDHGKPPPPRTQVESAPPSVPPSARPEPVATPSARPGGGPIPSGFTPPERQELLNMEQHLTEHNTRLPEVVKEIERLQKLSRIIKDGIPDENTSRLNQMIQERQALERSIEQAKEIIKRIGGKK